MRNNLFRGSCSPNIRPSVSKGKSAPACCKAFCRVTLRCTPNTPHRARQDERHDITRPNKARHRGDQAPASLPWPAPGRKQLTWVFKQYWLGRAGRLLGGAAAHGLPETPPALPAPKGPWRNEGRTLRLSTQKNRLQA